MTENGQCATREALEHLCRNPLYSKLLRRWHSVGTLSPAGRRFKGDRITGVSLSDRMVFFSNTMEPLRSSVSFTVGQPGTFKVLVTDLAPGRWTVRKDGNIIIPEVVVNLNEGTLYFTAAKGSYELIFY